MGKFFIATENDPEPLTEDDFGWYTASKKNGGLHQLSLLLEELLPGDGSQEPFVLYIHGWGEYPENAYTQEELPGLENEYDALALMFHWPSWLGFRTLPGGNAKASRKYLAEGLRELAQYLKTPGNALTGRRRVLLIHSMGALVFKTFMEDYDGELPDFLFHAIILNAPDVQLANHFRWMDKITFGKKVYVLMNSNDRVLSYEMVHLKKTRLGMLLTHPDGKMEPLAKNAVYVQTGNTTSGHKHFLAQRNLALKKVFQTIISGHENVLSNGLLKEIVPGKVYRVRAD